MPLSPQQLDRLGALLLAAAPGENPVPAIRAGLPGMAVSRCDAADLAGETLFLRAGNYDVFLVDNSEHCWRITDDPRLAGGVVIANRER